MLAQDANAAAFTRGTLLTRLDSSLPVNNLRSADRCKQPRAVRPEAQILTVNDDLNIISPELTVIIPTRNERENVDPLLDG